MRTNHLCACVTPRRLALATAALLACLAVVAAGCASSDDGPRGDASTQATPAPPPASDMTSTPTQPATDAEPEPETPGGEVVTVYLADDQGELVSTEVGVGDAPPLVAAVEALAAPPAGAGEPAALPPGTTVRSVRAEDRVATVDLSTEFALGYPSGGSAAETAILGPLVYTVTEFDGIDQVLIVVDGGEPVIVGSAYDFSAPLRREDVPAVLAANP